jgi:stage III sporulation protein AA
MERKIAWSGALKKYLPQAIFTALSAIDKNIASSIEEIRLRTMRPLMIYTCDKGYCVNADGGLSDSSGLSDSNGLFVSDDDVEQTFNALTGQSPYAFEDEVRQGFLTLGSGIRAGLAGSALLTGGNLRTYKTVSGINFRIPREAKGIAQGLLPYLTREGRLQSMLIISPPRLGKTTLVRDIARCAGSGIGVNPHRVTVVDERQELAASVYGRPLFDVGRETDVISGVLKAMGVFMALRSLSPDVIVTDEIGKTDDLEALREVANSGVVMIATAHAPDFENLQNKLFFKKICEERMFDSYVVLSASMGRITVSQIHDRLGQERLKNPFRLKALEAL